MNRIILLALTVLLLPAGFALAQEGGGDGDKAMAVNNRAGKLANDPAREQEFMDWGPGMFLHWSLDSQLGSFISHSSMKNLSKFGGATAVGGK